MDFGNPVQQQIWGFPHLYIYFADVLWDVKMKNSEQDIHKTPSKN